MTERFNEFYESIKRGLEQAIEEAHFLGKEMVLTYPDDSEQTFPVPSGTIVNVVSETGETDTGMEIYRVEYKDQRFDVAEDFLKDIQSK